MGEIRGILMNSALGNGKMITRQRSGRKDHARFLGKNERSINRKLLAMCENNACHFDMSSLLSLEGLKPFGPIPWNQRHRVEAISGSSPRFGGAK